jgi:hypothetical protein
MTERILAFALLLWPLAALADAGYFCSFETSPMDCGFKEQAKVPGRASLVGIARDGSKAVRLYTEPGDNDVRGSGTWERNDLTLDQARTGCYEGAEQWWAHSVLFPGDYVAAAEGGVVAAFHHTGGRGQANFQIFVKPEGLRFTGAGGPSVAFRSGDPGYYQKYLGPLVKNRWYDFVYHVKWSSDSDGFMFAWVNGVQELAHRGPTLYAGQGCYFKLANYHAASGAPSAVIHDRVVRGSSAAEVSLTPLQHVLQPAVP